jgi:molybdopterin molybdotransferase
VGWRFFVDFYMRRLLGLTLEEPILARLAHSLPKPPGMSCVFKAFVEDGDGERQVKILEGQGSHLISPLLEANCWAILPAAAGMLEAGECISVFPLHASGIPTIIS